VIHDAPIIVTCVENRADAAWGWLCPLKSRTFGRDERNRIERSSWPGKVSPETVSEKLQIVVNSR